MSTSFAARGKFQPLEQRLFIQAQDRRVPAVVWTPAAASAPRPLVLIGHGGSGHKTSQLVLDAAMPLVQVHGFVVAAIDGPVHGERRAAFDAGAGVRDEFRALWAAGVSVDPMIADWRATLDHLCTLPAVDAQAIGWYGISMGTAYGLPFVAAEPRIRAAVLGMWGTSRVNSGRLVEDARRVTVPVLFQQKSDDEFFTQDGQVELYEALASSEKRLAVYPGGHTDPAGMQLADLVGFLASQLQQD